ncbi:MAG: DUF2834 domain-containing protein [Anaerolineaceae bacterium]|nr:DUF2834 domain-containing protein [Anaerolineaceae bacterium]
MKRYMYLVLAIIGFILPYYFFVPFVIENGLDFALMIEQLLQTPIAAFFGADVIISAVVLLIFVFVEGTRLRMNNLWSYVLTTLIVGVSFTLPLFLYFRETKINRKKSYKRH